LIYHISWWAIILYQDHRRDQLNQKWEHKSVFIYLLYVSVNDIEPLTFAIESLWDWSVAIRLYVRLHSYLILSISDWLIFFNFIDVIYLNIMFQQWSVAQWILPLVVVLSELIRGTNLHRPLDSSRHRRYVFKYNEYMCVYILVYICIYINKNMCINIPIYTGC
jgi:hypothetical protein